MDKRRTLLYNKAKNKCLNSGKRDILRQKQKAVVTIGLISINAIVFVILMLFGKTEDTLFILEHGAMYEPYIVEGHEYYRLITSMFLHFGIEHLMNNMVMFGAMGLNLEIEIGKLRFLLIYMLSGIGGNVCSLLWNLYEETAVVSAGASGAVFGIMGALVCAAIQNRCYVGRLNKRGLIFMAALSLYFGLTGSGIDNAAHIGGLICGFVLQSILGGLRKRCYQDLP